MDLDILTSQVVTYGGSVTAKDRQTLSAISPYLFERMAGRAGYALQRDIYQCFDPNNVFYRDKMFNITKFKKMGWLEKLMRENKQVNFILNKFG